MKVLGYGWIKSGDTLNKALEQYGVKNGIIQSKVPGKEKELVASISDAKKDVQKSLEDKDMRKSAKPRYFRLVLEEVEN